MFSEKEIDFAYKVAKETGDIPVQLNIESFFDKVIGIEEFSSMDIVETFMSKHRICEQTKESLKDALLSEEKGKRELLRTITHSNVPPMFMVSPSDVIVGTIRLKNCHTHQDTFFGEYLEINERLNAMATTEKVRNLLSFKKLDGDLGLCSYTYYFQISTDGLYLIIATSEYESIINPIFITMDDEEIIKIIDEIGVSGPFEERLIVVKSGDEDRSSRDPGAAV